MAASNFKSSNYWAGQDQNNNKYDTNQSKDQGGKQVPIEQQQSGSEKRQTGYSAPSQQQEQKLGNNIKATDESAYKNNKIKGLDQKENAGIADTGVDVKINQSKNSELEVDYDAMINKNRIQKDSLLQSLQSDSASLKNKLMLEKMKKDVAKKQVAADKLPEKQRIIDRLLEEKQMDADVLDTKRASLNIELESLNQRIQAAMLAKKAKK